MKKFYFYLAGLALLASGSEMVSKLTGNTSAAYERVEKPAANFVQKTQVKIPFVRKKQGTKRLLAPGISATNTYAITNGSNTAGGELEYTIVITNSGPDAATGTTFSETIDVNTTLVAGSVKVSPVAVNDSYSTIGNVGINVASDQGLFANDVSPSGSALGVSSASNVTTVNGGTATITANSGAFTYEPAAGFTGTDTFTYDIENGSGLTASATVTISVTSAIWFINDDAAGGGTGTLSKPFNSLGAFQAINTGGANRPQDGHAIFIYSGNYDGGITLLNNQKVFGQGAGPSLLTLTGLATPSGSNLLPATGGTRPSIVSSGGDVFNMSGAATVQGLNIGNSLGAKFISGAAGKFTASEIDLTGTGAAFNISGKELAVIFGQVSSTVSGSSPIKLSNVTGGLMISSGTLTATNAPAVDISGPIALNVNLDAVNANGGNKGMIISGTSGTFQVTGSGTNTGTGGTIQNISQRGIELQNTTNITLKNMNLVNANQVDGTTPAGTTSPADMNNSGANAAVYALSTNGLTMDRVFISGTVAQEGINLRGCSNFNFTNGAIGSSGSQSNSFEGCIFAVNTGGTNSIVNATLSDPGGRVAYFANFSTNMTKLTVDNSVFQDADGASGLQVIGYGTSVMNVKVTNNSKFLNCRTAGIEIYANETSQVTSDIRSSVVDPGSGIGRGIDVAAFNDATAKFHLESNSVKHNGGIGINTFAFQNGFMEGTILNNTTENAVGSNGVSGIVSSSEGITSGQNTARGTVLIQGNTVKNATNIHGISILANNTSSALSNYTMVNNNVEVTGTTAFFYGIDVTAPSLGEVTPNNSAKICSNVTGNVINLPAPTRIAYRARAGSPTSEVRLQGAGPTVAAVWNAGGNTPADRAIQSGFGTISYNATCVLPGAVNLREAIAEDMSSGKPDASSAAAVVTETQPETLAVASAIELINKQVADSVAPSPARTEAAQAGETVTVNGTGSGFILASGKSTTIKFKVTINSDIAPSVCQLSTQGTISGSNFGSLLTDDPAGPGSSDATVTTITSTPVITSCPGDQTLSPDAATCTSTQTFAAAVDACPAATLTYTVNGNPITFPYAFPAGATTVQVTASNGIGTAPTCSFVVTVTPTPAPPITDEPDPQTICAGANTSFTVASSQSGVIYQWQKKPFGGSFSDIALAENATADDATLTLTNVPASDDQSEYQCIVLNSCSSTTSAAAVLRVNEITSVTVSGTTTVNQGATTPVVTFEAAGGTLPYTFTYHVNGSSNVTVSTTGAATSATVSQSTGVTGVFTYELVSVSDALSCSLTPSTTQSATITVANDLSATISGTISTCQDAAQPVVTFTSVNGIAPFTFTYNIDGGADQTVSTTGSSTTATISASTATTGTFVYTLTNVSGAGDASTAVAGQTATISVSESPTIALSGAQYECTSGLNAYTVFFTASPGAVITSDKGVVSGNTVTGIPTKQTATITATLGTCSATLVAFKDCSLPVTLIEFNGFNVENTAVLQWRTAEETNSERFDIQRSSDGKKWEIVGTAKSNGESFTVKSYAFVDRQPGAGNNFYRLKMIDLDKTFAYSRVINVSFAHAVLQSGFHPNPVSDLLYLTSTDWSQVKSVEIYNMVGKSVYQSGAAVPQRISVKHLPVGMYILKIAHDNGQAVSRRVLVNR